MRDVEVQSEVEVEVEDVEVDGLKVGGDPLMITAMTISFYQSHPIYFIPYTGVCRLFVSSSTQSNILQHTRTLFYLCGRGPFPWQIVIDRLLQPARTHKTPSGVNEPV